MSLARIDHAEHPADRVEMTRTRAYLALQPRLAMAPEVRPAYDAFIEAVPAAEGVSFQEARLGGVAGWWCKPADAQAGAALLHFHGGGYVVGSAKAYRTFVSHLAHAARAPAFVPDYALAPERPFPAAPDDAHAVLSGLQDAGLERVVVSGDSAGGGLALALVQKASLNRTEKSLHIGGVVAMSPWTDLTLTAASLDERASADPVLSREQLAQAAHLYAGAEPDRRDPRLSPRFGSMTGMPPVMIHVGADEVLLDDALAYGEAAEAQGASAEVHVWAGMTHVFPASLTTLHAAREAISRIGTFVRARLKGGEA